MQCPECSKLGLSNPLIQISDKGLLDFTFYKCSAGHIYSEDTRGTLHREIKMGPMQNHPNKLNQTGKYLLSFDFSRESKNAAGKYGISFIFTVQATNNANYPCNSQCAIIFALKNLENEIVIDGRDAASIFISEIQQIIRAPIIEGTRLAELFHGGEWLKGLWILVDCETYTENGTPFVGWGILWGSFKHGQAKPTGPLPSVE